MVGRARKRILRFLERRGTITLQTAPGDGEVTVVGDEAMGEKDPLLATLLAAATTGAPPAGWARKRKPVRIVCDPDDQPVAKGTLCAQDAGFNLHAARRVAANDRQGREGLCRYILRPPFANDRLKILDSGSVKLAFKKPWSDGTTSVELEPMAFIARLAALVPLMDPILAELEAVARRASFAPHRLPRLSNLTGKFLAGGEVPDAARAPPDSPDHDRGHRPKDPGRHAPAHRGAPTTPRARSARIARRDGWRRLDQLAAAAAATPTAPSWSRRRLVIATALPAGPPPQPAARSASTRARHLRTGGVLDPEIPR